MIPFNFHHLYYFYIIHKEGSVSKAAKSLRVTQPTLSAQLKQFEAFLEIKLFDREGKKLVLTEQGQMILSYAQDIFNTGREMLDAAQDRATAGRIRVQIGAPSFIPKSFLDALLMFLLKIEPGIYFNVKVASTEMLIEDLKLHTLDLVITDSPLESQNPEAATLRKQLIDRVPVIFCANRGLAGKIKRFPQDLAHIPVILPTSHSQVYHSIQEYFIRHRVTPKVIGEVQDFEVVRRLVLAGKGIAPLNEFTVANAPSKNSLVTLGSPAHPVCYENLYVLCAKRKKTHPLVERVFSDFKLDRKG